MKKSNLAIFVLGMGIAVGSAGVTYAWHGKYERHAFDDYGYNHRQIEHGYDISRNIAANAIAYNEHGGAHETAPNNAAIHQAEMDNPAHRLPDNADPKIPFDQHGGGHEFAKDNSSIHEKELKNPAHKDI